MDFDALNQRIAPPDEAARTRCEARWANLAKPVGSLGLLEQLVMKIAALTGDAESISVSPRAVLVCCADNGVTAESVASTPPEITATMSRFIANGRSSVCLMAKAANADVFAYDFGVFTKVGEKNLLDRRVMPGTNNMAHQPAMTREEAITAIERGIALVQEKKEGGYRLLATGEMGIGNTSTTSAVTAALLGLSPAETTGRGVGLTDEGYQHKIETVERALKVNHPDPTDALDVLSKVGGLDIAAMAGVFIGGALYRVPIVIDGVISACAALVASRLCPNAVLAMLPSHVSAEPAAGKLLSALGLTAILHADMRLGEGTGAALLFPILDEAVAVYDHLMTFADIGM